MSAAHPIILHHFDESPFSEKIRLIFGLQEDRVDLGADHADHAAARSDADDRRLSPHAGDADRRRHLLRHPMHHARAGAALSGTEPVAERLSKAWPGAARCGPTARSSRARSTSCSARSPTRCRPIHRRPREAARREVRRRRHDGGDPADARPVSRPSCMDRRAALRRAHLACRRQRRACSTSTPI